MLPLSIVLTAGVAATCRPTMWLPMPGSDSASIAEGLSAHAVKDSTLFHTLTHSHTERPSWDVALSLRIYSLSQYICRRSLFTDADESIEFRHKSQAILFISIVALWHHSVFVLPIRRPGPTDRARDGFRLKNCRGNQRSSACNGCRCPLCRHRRRRRRRRRHDGCVCLSLRRVRYRPT